MHVIKRFIVSGRVQGVGFRASARDVARRCRLRGWVRNLPDGRVEVLASGPETALQTLRDWLRHGPRAARVDGVEEIATTDEERPEGEFAIR